MPTEPSQADIAEVANVIGEQPAPQPTPQPVAEPAPAVPAPVAEPEPVVPAQPSDPFESLIQPTEPAAPAAEHVTPAPAEQPKKEDTYQSYDEYMSEVLKSVPKPKDVPDPNSISPDDPEGLKKFFDDLVNAAVDKAQTEVTRKSAIQAKERALWDEAFDKYGSIKTNKNLRDMVHNIRIGYFNRGIAITPKQAADKLLESLGNQYKQGVADNQVVTTIESVQPNAGGTVQQVQTTADRAKMLELLQTGGETALAEMLDAQIKAGNL